jgi:hypothetical protein
LAALATKVWMRVLSGRVEPLRSIAQMHLRARSAKNSAPS